MDESRRGVLSRLGVGAALGAVFGFAARDLHLQGVVSYWGDPVPLVALSGVAGALVWSTRLRSLLAAAAVVVALLWSAAAFTPLSRSMTQGLVRREAPQPADAVFVLASHLQKDGEPTAAAMTRLLRGLELLAEGRAPRLIVSELHPPTPSYAAYARALMARLGLRQEVLAIGPVGRTHEEAVALAALCRERGWKRILVVTSPTHSLRASAAVERQGLEVVSLPAIETRFDLETQERGDERLEAFGAALHEHLGLWVYARRGWVAKPAASQTVKP